MPGYLARRRPGDDINYGHAIQRHTQRLYPRTLGSHPKDLRQDGWGVGWESGGGKGRNMADVTLLKRTNTKWLRIISFS